MTVREAIDSFREAYPSEFGDDILTAWLSELESTVVCEIVLTHEGAPEGASSFAGFKLGVNDDDELTAKEPYSKIYTDYLRMKYDASSSFFSASWADFADWYNRRHMPKAAADVLSV